MLQAPAQLFYTQHDLRDRTALSRIVVPDMDRLTHFSDDRVLRVLIRLRSCSEIYKWIRRSFRRQKSKSQLIDQSRMVYGSPYFIFSLRMAAKNVL